jgi:hypothetical protein
MIQDDTDRLIMSDSLVGMLPSLDQETISAAEESFVVAALDFDFDLIVGSLSGISIENTASAKIDIQVSLNEAYSVVKNFSTSGLSCRVLYLRFGNDEFCMEGPFQVISSKIMELDRQNKMCVLGVDLIKV